MATVNQIKNKIQKHERELARLRKSITVEKRKLRKKKASGPLTLNDCMKVFNAIRDANLESKFYDNVKASRVYYKEICEHLLSGRMVEISDGRGNIITYSNIRRDPYANRPWTMGTRVSATNCQAGLGREYRSADNLPDLLHVLTHNMIYMSFERSYPPCELTIEFM